MSIKQDPIHLKPAEEPELVEQTEIPPEPSIIPRPPTPPPMPNLEFENLLGKEKSSLYKTFFIAAKS